MSTKNTINNAVICNMCPCDISCLVLSSDSTLPSYYRLASLLYHLIIGLNTIRIPFTHLMVWHALHFLCFMRGASELIVGKWRNSTVFIELIDLGWEVLVVIRRDRSWCVWRRYVETWELNLAGGSLLSLCRWILKQKFTTTCFGLRSRFQRENIFF